MNTYPTKVASLTLAPYTPPTRPGRPLKSCALPAGKKPIGRPKKANSGPATFSPEVEARKVRQIKTGLAIFVLIVNILAWWPIIRMIWQ